jgi:iron complex transport system ATP-binding protein
MDFKTMLIEINKLTFSYNHKAILENVSLQVNTGEQWAIIGKNGVGKSTLIKCIAGLEKVPSRKIQIAGKNIENYNTKELATIIAYVPQVSGGNLPYTVFDYVMMGRFPYQGFMALPSENDRRIVLESLRLTDTQGFAVRKMNTLSGGEMQRVFLAGAVAQRTKIMLLDEPTTFLDPYHQQFISQTMDRIHKEFNTTILSATHEMSSINLRYSNILAIKNGLIFYAGSIDDFNNKSPEILNQIFNVQFELITLDNGQRVILPRSGN